MASKRKPAKPEQEYVVYNLSPPARFPATPEGLQNAIACAKAGGQRRPLYLRTLCTATDADKHEPVNY